MPAPAPLEPLPGLDARTLALEPRRLAAVMPDLKAEAHRIAATVLAGFHGRKMAGPGDSFWQYRAYGSGEPAHRIDWRRSARGETLYVREMEWEAAHTIRLHLDFSPSMYFGTPAAHHPKRDRAVLLALAAAELLLTSGERVGLLTGERPRPGSQTLNGLIAGLVMADENGPLSGPLVAIDDIPRMRPREELILLSDFLGSADEREATFDALTGRGLRCHLVHIIDPVEEAFPFSGRTEFVDPETGDKLTAGRAEEWRARYATLFGEFKAMLARNARKRDWSYTQSHTSEPAAPALLALHAALARGKEG